MKQWDIFLFPFTEELPHPVVILSGDERVAARKHVNGLLCVSSAALLGGTQPLRSMRTRSLLPGLRSAGEDLTTDTGRTRLTP
jgi:hypothetical protein